MDQLKALTYFNASFRYIDGPNYFEVQLDIDSNDVVTNIGAKSNTINWNESFKNLKESTINNSIHNLNFLELDRLNIVAFTTIMAIEEYTGKINQNSKDYGINTDKLICRCQGVDSTQLSKAIDIHQADVSKIIAQLKVSLVCGGCRPVVDKVIAASSWKKDFFADIENSRWQEMIDVAISRAKQLKNSMIPCELEYSIIKYQNNKVKLRVKGDRQGKNRFELTELVQLFLREKVHPEISVSIVL